MLPLGETLICQEPQNLDIFEWLIEHAGQSDRRGTYRANVERAKTVCAECPTDIKDACLEALGHDYNMGVIAGMTDAERHRLYKGRAA